MVNMQVSSTQNIAADANEDFQPSNLVNGENQATQDLEPQLNQQYATPLQRDLSHLDTNRSIFFNDAIFTIRCSVSEISVSNLELLDQLRVKNCLSENPGSYPTLYNEVDMISHYEAFHTDTKLALKMDNNLLANIGSYLPLEDVRQFRQINKKFHVSANIAIYHNVQRFRKEVKSFEQRTRLDLPDTEFKYDLNPIEDHEDIE